MTNNVRVHKAQRIYVLALVVLKVIAGGTC